MHARQKYLNGELTHSEYYGLLVERLGEAYLRSLLPAKTPDEWRKLLAQDKHLNNVSLATWDAGHPRVVVRVRRMGGTKALESIIGPGGWSLSDSVCLLKETARRYAEESE